VSHARRVVETIARSSPVSDCLARRGTRGRSAVASSSVANSGIHCVSTLNSSVAITWACRQLVYATHDGYSCARRAVGASNAGVGDLCAFRTFVRRSRSMRAG
jgi:hypothetical protein